MDADGIAQIIGAFGEFGNAGLIVICNLAWLGALIYLGLKLVKPTVRIADALEDLAEIRRKQNAG